MILNTAQVVKDDHFAQYENQDSDKVPTSRNVCCGEASFFTMHKWARCLQPWVVTHPESRHFV